MRQVVIEGTHSTPDGEQKVNHCVMRSLMCWNNYATSRVMPLRQLRIDYATLSVMPIRQLWIDNTTLSVMSIRQTAKSLCNFKCYGH